MRRGHVPEYASRCSPQPLMRRSRRSTRTNHFASTPVHRESSARSTSRPAARPSSAARLSRRASSLSAPSMSET